MKIAVLGATGRTGRPLVATLLDRGHEVTALVRDPSKVAGSGITVVAGSSTDPDAMTALVAGADAVVSALGPTNKESDLHTQTAQILVDLLPAGARFVGIGGAGIDVPGDQKGGRDKFVSKLLQTFGGVVDAERSRRDPRLRRLFGEDACEAGQDLRLEEVDAPHDEGPGERGLDLGLREGL